MNIIKTLTIISITSSLFGLGASSYAGETLSKDISVRSRVVTFYDLDLAKPADARILLHRIHAVAKVACNRISDRPIELHPNIDGDRCVTASVRDTVAEVNRRFNTNIGKVAGMNEEKRNLVSKR